MKRILFSLAALLVVGCSAHVDGGTPNLTAGVPQKPDVFDHAAVAGPNVIGTWQSGCVANAFGSGYRKAQIQYVDPSNFNYKNDLYSDRACTNQTKEETHAGLYQFSQKLSDTQWVIDYNYVENGVTYMMDGQKLETAGDTIYITEFLFGTLDVTHDVPFTKAGSAPASCQNYAGTYQMNMDLITITQNGCSEVKWAYDGGATYDYIVDGQAHSVNGVLTTAAFDSKGQLNVSSANSSGQLMNQIFSYQTTPCHLANPDGTSYLTRDVYVNGTWSFDSCAYWNKQ